MVLGNALEPISQKKSSAAAFAFWRPFPRVAFPVLLLVPVLREELVRRRVLVVFEPEGTGADCSVQAIHAICGDQINRNILSTKVDLPEA